MGKNYIGVKQDERSKKWRCLIKKLGNKRRTPLKDEFDTAKEAAIYRDLYILNHEYDPAKKPILIGKKYIFFTQLDKNDKANIRNFSKKKVIKLNKKWMKKKTEKFFGKKKAKKNPKK